MKKIVITTGKALYLESVEVLLSRGAGAEHMQALESYLETVAGPSVDSGALTRGEALELARGYVASSAFPPYELRRTGGCVDPRGAVSSTPVFHLCSLPPVAPVALKTSSMSIRSTRDRLAMWGRKEARRSVLKWGKKQWARYNWKGEAKELEACHDTGGQTESWDKLGVQYGSALDPVCENRVEIIEGIFLETILSELLPWFDHTSELNQRKIHRWLTSGAEWAKVGGAWTLGLSIPEFRNIWKRSIGKAKRAAGKFKSGAQTKDQLSPAIGEWNLSIPSSPFNSDPKKGVASGTDFHLDTFKVVKSDYDLAGFSLALKKSNLLKKAREAREYAKVNGGRSGESATKLESLAAFVDGEPMTPEQAEFWLEEGKRKRFRLTRRASKFLCRQGIVKA
jgi:hypothetical protein